MIKLNKKEKESLELIYDLSGSQPRFKREQNSDGIRFSDREQLRKRRQCII